MILGAATVGVIGLIAVCLIGLRSAHPGDDQGSHEAAWSSIYSTKSRPFPAPQSGKVAVKVINHYGDEVLEVFDV